MHESLGKHLKDYRNKNKFTQKELATILHVTDKAIYKWENSRGLPDIETILQLTSLMNMPVEDLLRYREEQVYFEYQSQRMWFHLAVIHILIPNFVYLFDRSVSVKEFFDQLRYLPCAKGGSVWDSKL